MKKSKKQLGDKYWQFIEPIWNEVSIYDRAEVFLTQFREIRPEQGHLLAAHWCQSEVNNGGLHQFFYNPTGVLAPEAVIGFRAIELEACATVLEEAMSFFGDPYPRDQEERIKALDQVSGESEEIWNPFYHLDDKFFDGLGYEDSKFLSAADEYAVRVGREQKVNGHGHNI
jgi:hypothetical protein